MSSLSKNPVFISQGIAGQPGVQGPPGKIGPDGKAGMQGEYLILSRTEKNIIFVFYRKYRHER